MAELADAADSKSAEGNLMGVRFPLPAPRLQKTYSEMASTTREAIFLRWLFWWLFVYPVLKLGPLSCYLDAFAKRNGDPESWA
jgi:hypothetical protein